MRLRRNAMIIMGSLGLVLLSTSHAMAQSGDGGYRIFRPDGSGPHPGVVFASGCSGFTVSKEYVLLAEELRGQGYVVVFADYLGRRNLKVCDGGAVSLSDAGKDVVAAAAWLKSQPSIDPTRIAVIGWSYGGGAVLTALAEHSQEQLIFSRAIVYYAVCCEVLPWKVTIPVLMLFGSEDHVTPAKACQQVAKESATEDMVKIVVYPGAYHSFDNSALPAKTTYRFGTIGYNPLAAAAAREEIRKFLPAK